MGTFACSYSMSEMSWMNTNISKVTMEKQYLSHTNFPNGCRNLPVSLNLSTFCRPLYIFMYTSICMCANEDFTWAGLWLRICVWLAACVTFASSCFPVTHAKPGIRSPLYYRINCFSFSTCPLSLVPLPFCVMHLQSYRDWFLSSQLLTCKHP